MKIGIIGAENSHTGAIAKTLNVDKCVKGFSVDYVWGETAAFAKAAAEKGQIPNIVKKTTDMLGKIDAVIVDHRHPKYHLKAVLPYVKAGIPTFVDKPFCYRAKEGKEFLAVAKKAKTPVTSFSSIPTQKAARDYMKKIKKIGDIKCATFYGPSDLKSVYGGIFFYGIHQIDFALEAFGCDVNKVLLTKSGENATAQLMYKDSKVITVNLIKEGCHRFSSTAVGTEKTLHFDLVSDKNPYLTGVKTICKMFKSGKEPIPHARMLKPVQVLEALQKSQKSGKIERV
ncbi:MAG: Gfo/Idh/MocA family oxidoreductase [Planctomycetota bacterium]|jgi:predicted dehydrogenase